MAPITQAALVVPNSTVGAVEIGMLLGSFLFGLVTCQAYVYYQRFPKDTILFKLLVGVIWSVELCHTVANSSYLYTMTVTNYANPIGVITAPVSLGIGIMCSAFIGPLVQAWFAYRVLKFSGSFYIPIACWFLSALRCASTIAVAVEAIQAAGGDVIEFERTYRWLLIFILTVGAAVDILIAASLCYYFRKHAKKSGVFSKTMNQLMLWTIESGLLTSVTAVTMLVCYLTMQDNYIWIAIFTFLAKLFSNTFLAALNARNPKSHDLNEKADKKQRCISISTFGTSTSSFNSPYSPNTSHTSFTTPAASVKSPRRTYAPAPKPSLTIQMSYSTDVAYDASERPEQQQPERPVSERWRLMQQHMAHEAQSPTSPSALYGERPVSFAQPTGIAY